MISLITHVVLLFNTYYNEYYYLFNLENAAWSLSTCIGEANEKMLGATPCESTQCSWGSEEYEADLHVVWSQGHNQ